MTSGRLPAGAVPSSPWTRVPRSTGAGALPRNSTPPTPPRTSEATAARSKFRTGTATTSAARRATGHDRMTCALLHDAPPDLDDGVDETGGETADGVTGRVGDVMGDAVGFVETRPHPAAKTTPTTTAAQLTNRRPSAARAARRPTPRCDPLDNTLPRLP